MWGAGPGGPPPSGGGGDPWSQPPPQMMGQQNSDSSQYSLNPNHYTNIPHNQGISIWILYK